MQAVSAGYEPYAKDRFLSVLASFELIDLDAWSQVSHASSGEAVISKIAQTHDKITSPTSKIATIEPNYFVLDGTYKLPSETDNGQIGWWSEVLSGTDRTFMTAPYLEFVVSTDQSSVGFSIYFDDKSGEVASDFSIEAWDAGGVLIGRKSIVDNAAVFVAIDLPSDLWRRVRVTFTKTVNPQRRVRVVEVLFGIVQVYDTPKTTELKLLYELDPIMATLPSCEAELTINNQNRRYNLINPAGIYKFLQQGQKLSLKFGVGTTKTEFEMVDMGDFAFHASQTEDDAMTAKIIAYDPLMMLGAGEYKKGRSTTGTLQQVVADILADSGQVITVAIDPSVAQNIIGWTIPLVSHREALRLACQAARAVCYFTRKGLKIAGLFALGPPVDTMTGGRMEKPAQVHVDEYINAVDVNAYGYYGSLTTTKISSQDITVSGTQTIWLKYDAAQSVSAGLSAGALVAAEYYLRACKLTIVASGPVTVTINGDKLTEVRQVCSAENLEGNQRAALIIDNRCVWPVNAQTVADWVLAVKQKRVSITVLGRGNPAVDIADTATVYDYFGVNRNALIVKNELDYSVDGLSAQINLWGA